MIKEQDNYDAPPAPTTRAIPHPGRESRTTRPPGRTTRSNPYRLGPRFRPLRVFVRSRIPRGDRSGPSTRDTGTGTGSGLGWGERGAATVELAVLFPVFLLLIFGGVQAAEWYYVRSLCLAAAQAGVHTGHARGATDADARQAAADYLTRTGASTAANAAVSTAGSTPTAVRVEVSADVPRVIPLPGLSIRVTQSARVPREIFSTGTAP
jgi:Flp pilus assembly protein TadG